MDSRRVGRALAWASVMVVCGVSLSASSAPGANDGDEAPKIVRATVGATTEVPDQPRHYERVLLAPPDDAEMSPEAAWEIDADLAVKLGRLPEGERWAVIRRNLELSPEGAGKDVILWREVVDVVLDTIGTLHTKAEGGPPAFGLQVAFPLPDEDPSHPVPEVALTFAKAAKRDLDKELVRKIAEEMTGVEGFLEPAPRNPANVRVELVDASGETSSTHLDRTGYFCFPHLPVDPDFGADYTVQVYVNVPPSEGEGPAEAAWTKTTSRYVPVKNGARSRAHLTDWQPPGFRIMTVAPAYVELIEQFVGGVPLLGNILQRLTPNPGLHVGAVAVRGSGLQPIWSTRYLLKTPTIDRGPKMVAEGTMRLECLTPTDGDGPAGVHYVRITLLGQASKADLDMGSRPTNETPWGIGIGVVPSADPTLYAIGPSYRLARGAQVLAGVGIQQGSSSSFVYGITVDLDRILNGVFGAVKGGSR